MIVNSPSRSEISDAVFLCLTSVILLFRAKNLWKKHSFIVLLNPVASYGNRTYDLLVTYLFLSNHSGICRRHMYLWSYNHFVAFYSLVKWLADSNRRSSYHNLCMIFNSMHDDLMLCSALCCCREDGGSLRSRVPRKKCLHLRRDEITRVPWDHGCFRCVRPCQ